MSLALVVPTVARSRRSLADALAPLRDAGTRIVLVPTMGALHAGHLSLFQRARELGGTVVASVFVNPLQFGPGEDLARYPRDLERDADMAGSQGVSLVFAPDEGQMYPDGDARIRVTPGAMGDGLCGPFRPGHFEGVLTVVAKLFGLIRPDVAVFGRKDLQQAALIRRMVRDLELRVEIEVCPTVRDADGIALSSRNAYLTPDDRVQARGLVRGLAAADEAFRAGVTAREPLLARVLEVAAEHPRLVVQYADLIDADSLEPLPSARTGAALAVAGLVGGTRLIDNLILGADAADPRSSPDA